MSLGAMMRRRAATFANSVDLVAATPWVVPGGVTSLNFFGATQGGGVITESLGASFGGGGGGGALILNGVATVVPGETLTVTTTVLAAYVQYLVSGSITGPILTIESGRNQMNGGVTVTQGGDGSAVVWAPTSQTCNAGQTVNITGGGVMIGGGAGGTGGTSTPPVLGTAGGASGGGVYAPVAGGANYGGGGGGFFPGNAWLAPGAPPTQTQTRGAAFIRVRY